MKIEEFEDFVDRLGEEVDSWPSPEREQGLALLQRSNAARGVISRAKLLRSAMRATAPVRAPAGLADRIVSQATMLRPGVPSAAPGFWTGQVVAFRAAVGALRPSVFLPLCFLVGIAAGWLPGAFQSRGLQLDVPVILTGMVE
jgi:hypothetical protein